MSKISKCYRDDIKDLALDIIVTDIVNKTYAKGRLLNEINTVPLKMRLFVTMARESQLKYKTVRLNRDES